MWHLFAAEIRYTFVNLVLVDTIIILGVLAYFQVSPTAGVSAMLMPLTAATALQLLTLRGIEKRDRHSVLLPIPIKQIAWARLWLFLMPAIGFYGIYLLLYFLCKDASLRWHHEAYDLLMFFGLLLAGFSIYFILHDLFSAFSRRWKFSDSDIVILIVVLAAALLGIPLAIAVLKNAPAVDVLRLTCFLFGFVVLYPAVVIYARRKTYLE